MLIFEETEKSFPGLKEMLGEERLNEFINCEYDQLSEYHFGLGTFIRNNLLTEDSSVYKLFLKSGVTSLDDMSDLIIKLFYISLHIERE